MINLLGKMTRTLDKKSDLLIGIPYFNRYDLLEKNISSLKNKGDIMIINNSINNQSNYDALRFLSNIAIVDQTMNIGVSASWNLILKYAIKYKYKHVLITSTDVEHKEGNIELALEDFERSKDCFLGHIEDYNSFYIDPKIVDIVGWFDENYYPAYCEDTDYTYRIYLAGLYKKPLIVGENPPIHLRSQTVLSDKSLFPKFQYTYDYNKIYFKKKWGVWDFNMIESCGNSLHLLFKEKIKDFGAYIHPFNDLGKDHKYWSEPEDLHLRDWDKIEVIKNIESISYKVFSKHI